MTSFENFIRRISARFGVHISRTAQRVEILNLIGELKPRLAGRDLVRLGPSTDGGYLVPNVLDGVEYCFSPGVDVESGFEVDCAERGMQVFLADASVESPPIDHPSFRFRKNFLGMIDEKEFLTLESWVSDCIGNENQGTNLILQMDIEGAEYEVLAATSVECLNRFRVMVIEFHDLDQMWSRRFFKFASSVFRKILSNHVCVHIHPNNVAKQFDVAGVAIPPIMEFTFLHKQWVQASGYANEFPHPLDCDNTRNPSLRLPSCWIG